MADIQSLGTLLRQLYISSILALSLALLSFVQPVFATSSPPPLICNLGVYLVSLQELNVAEGSFGADFWVWVNCPTKSSDILEKMDFVNSKQINPSLDSDQKKGQIYWSNRKIQGIFKHDWSVGNFPFDRHRLKIEIEHGLLDRNQLIYQVDRQTSNYQKKMKIDGWQITKFTLKEYTNTYETTYGDPTLDPALGSEFSHVDVEIFIQRRSSIIFAKLTTAVYLALAISLAVYFVREFEARMGTLIGSLFAIVINQQVVDATLGKADGFKLVDAIHIMAMFYISVAVVLAILSHQDQEQGNQEIAIRRDLLSFKISAISFSIINLILIGYAAIAG